ncbi:hypothetical protein [Methanobacterium sp.]|jgi:hypothetical protein|uniref:hypothetical protein n=1 Tax=Methanobacterium sp. TaxID=2164 RepID=UPI0031592EEC
MKIGVWIIILGFMSLFATLGRFLLSGSTLDLFVVFFAIYVIIAGLALKKYVNMSIYYSAFLGVIILQGLTMAYAYVFTPVYTTETSFYIYLGIYILFVISFVYAFIHRQEYLNKIEELN